MGDLLFPFSFFQKKTTANINLFEYVTSSIGYWSFYLHEKDSEMKQSIYW